MRRLIQYKECWLSVVRRRPVQIKHSRALSSRINGESEEGMNEAAKRREAYKQLENLDFMTATKMLLTVPPKRKKFGLDFHLVQLFFCCLPSLAVYLVAMYSRREMRKMEAELEVKRKSEEATKAKELAEEKLRGPEGQLQEVKVRLEKLESIVQVIAVEAKKENASNKQGDEATLLGEVPRNNDPKAVDTKALGDKSSTSQSEAEGAKVHKPASPDPNLDSGQV